MSTYAIAVFVFTWCLMARERVPWFPVGRAAGTLVGAGLMVLGGVLSPAAALAAVDVGTLALLFGMMVLTAALAEAGALETAAHRLVVWFPKPEMFLWGMGLGVGLLSAVLVNDTVCLFATPVVLAACRRKNWPAVPFLLAIATASNVGSIGTLVGNPQLMLIGRMSGISFLRYLSIMGPISVVLLVVNMGIVWAFYARSLRRLTPSFVEPQGPSLDRPRARRALVVCALTMAAFLAGIDLPWAALMGAGLLLAWRFEPAGPLLARIDGGLLLFFAALFVVVKGVDATGLPARLFAAVAGSAFEVPTIVGLSNLVSNVPLVLLAGPHTTTEHGWLVLALASTTAGNLTLVGSAANLIVAEKSGLKFFQHLPVGILTAIVTTVVGVFMLRAI